MNSSAPTSRSTGRYPAGLRPSTRVTPVSFFVAARHKEDQGRVTNDRGVAMSIGSQIKGIYAVRVGHRLPGSCSGSPGELMFQRTRQQFAPPDAGTIGPRR
jgi:hypothetical protein